jgi:hypothetical protein
MLHWFSGLLSVLLEPSWERRARLKGYGFAPTPRLYPFIRFNRARDKDGLETIASTQIGSNQTKKGSFVISLPKLSSIKIEQHERRDQEAQRRSQE